MKAKIDKNINDTFNELSDILFSFTEDQLNIIPFEGSWTGGQVADHIIKSLGAISWITEGPVEDAGREPGEKIKAVEDLFLNFKIKMQSPAFVMPGETHFEKDHLLNTISDLKKEMLEASALDLAMLCKAMEFPSFGYFTRLEMIHFLLVHMQRHTQQLKTIFHTLKQTV